MPTIHDLICFYCGSEFQREQRQVSSSLCKNVKNFFCTRSCSVSHQNKTVGHGEHRSFIEKWLQSRISEKWPSLEVSYNNKSTIGSELDLWFPSLNLAIELNGKTHYQVIYNEEVLRKTQKNDEEKRQKCKEKGIELLEVDMSKMNSIKRDPEFMKIVDLVFDAIQSRVKN